MLIATIALALVFQELMLFSFGGHYLGVPSPLEGTVRVLGVSIPYQRLLILAVAAATLAASWFLRRGSADFVPSGSAMILSFAGILLALVTLWIGGELVYRLGVAVDPGANVNAPSSLKQSTAVKSTEQRVNR